MRKLKKTASSFLKVKSDIAIALDYKDDDGAPVVSAKGQAELVYEMRKIARRYGVPQIMSSELASQLNELQDQQEIPRSLYRQVAILFASNAEKLRIRRSK